MKQQFSMRLQHQRRHLLAMDAGFLWDEVHTRMLDRMQWVKQSPSQVLVLGDANLRDARRLQSAYPTSAMAVLDWAWAAKSVSPETTNLMRTSPSSTGDQKPNWANRLWRRFIADEASSVQHAKPSGRDPSRGSERLLLQVAADAHQLPFRAGCFDLLWSNGLLHWSKHWPDLLREYHRCAKQDALFSFSSLGVDSFSALRSVAPDLMPFPDMHDLGDALVHAGWAEPVVDMDRITLTWRRPLDLLRDLRALGGHIHPGRAKHLRSRHWFSEVQVALEALRHPDGLLHLDIELILGHAWRAADRTAASDWQPIQLKMKVK